MAAAARKTKKTKATKELQGLTAQQWVDWWNERRHLTNPPLPRLIHLRNGRWKKLAARCDEFPGLLHLIYERLRAGVSDFALEWLSFGWLIESEGKMTRFLEGVYSSRKAGAPSNGTKQSWAQKRDQNDR